MKTCNDSRTLKAASRKKTQAALALAVSLWMATGGVASAAEKSVNSNTEISDNQSGTVYKLTNDNGVTFTVKSGGDVQAIYSEKNGNTIIVESGGTVSGNRYGSSIAGGVSHNTVTIETGATVTNCVQGGYSNRGEVTGNTVIVRGTVNDPVSGGETAVSSGSATGNRVIVDGGMVNSSVYGGRSGTATGNTVELHNAAVTNGLVRGGWALGNGDETKGNKLILSGTNTVSRTVENFEMIQFDSTKLAWTDGSTVLTAQGFDNAGKLDVSAVTGKATTPGTMTLLKATGNNLPTFALSTGGEITTAGVKVVNEAKTDGAGGVTIGYNNTHTVALATTNRAITYTVANSPVNKITLGEIAWSAGGTVFDGTGYDYTGVTNANIDTTNFKFTNPEAATGNMALLTGATNLTAGTNIAHSQDFTKTVNGATLSATLSGNVIRTTAGEIGYEATGKALTGVSLANWNGTTGSVPDGWTASLADNSITAAGFTAPTLEPETSKAILTTTTENFFKDSQITGEHQYKAHDFTEETATNGVTFSGKQSRGVTTADGGKNLVYAAGVMDVENISLGEMTWGEARDASGTGYNYANAAVDLSKFTFANPETISAGNTTLLQANDTLSAVLSDVAKPVSYQYNPVAGVTVEGAVNGSVSKDGNHIVYAATENKANKLTFGDVEWKDKGALMARPANITFAGADVDTTHINFTNIQSLDAGRKMTLVSDFGNSVGTITGAKYKVGSTLEGTGKASLSGSDLIFTAETGTTQEQTHNTVMGATVGMAALSAGNDFIGSATEGLALASNVGADGVSSFAQMGGGSMRQETGSHVDTHTWNAILALGHQNKKERGTFEYGAFFEYGTGNYTTHNGNERGDGSMHYTGGGLLAKWTANHGLYVEGSLRAGSVHDDARNVLRDDKGVPYSYETDAPYMGFHLGVGKEIAVAGGNAVDVYGKYFYNRRNGVSFDAGGHYDLDAVTSQVIRVGARYTLKREKWNFYAGTAYEHEFDGKAGGTADGVAIRGADTGGASFRGELGVTMKPDVNSPWSLDLNVAGFAGKKQGVTGGVSVSFMF